MLLNIARAECLRGDFIKDKSLIGISCNIYVHCKCLTGILIVFDLVSVNNVADDDSHRSTESFC